MREHAAHTVVRKARMFALRKHARTCFGFPVLMPGFEAGCPFVFRCKTCGSDELVSMSDLD